MGQRTQQRLLLQLRRQTLLQRLVHLTLRQQELLFLLLLHLTLLLLLLLLLALMRQLLLWVMVQFVRSRR
jgi:hypothetical protein